VGWQHHVTDGACLSACTISEVPHIMFSALQKAAKDLKVVWWRVFMCRAFERMLRRFLDLPSRPAVILLCSYTWVGVRMPGNRQHKLLLCGCPFIPPAFNASGLSEPAPASVLPPA
jgi:hypothetical protein